MSASLVGSEMCIRDRRPRCVTRKASVLYLPTAVAPRAPPLEQPTDQMLAVSYTHLTLPTICSV
eukprot:13438641-Alexandrium_andersonii.AAC.1